MSYNLITNLLTALLSFALSYLLFVPAKKLAASTGAVDMPNERKIHKAPTPRTGGLCFFLSFFLSVLLLHISLEIKLIILVGGAVIFLVGLLDDIFSISPWHKLCGQALAASVPLLSGVNFYSGNDPRLRALFGSFTFLWIVFLTNAVNLSDGLDCLAAGEGLSFSLSIALFALISGGERSELFFVALTLSLSLLGFLPHNRHPARIFMGDCGSLFLGYTLSLLSVIWLSGDTSARHILALPVLFAVPLSDTLQSFVRRILKGKSPFSADKGHFHHRLLSAGFSHSNTVFALCTLSVLSSFISELLFLM